MKLLAALSGLSAITVTLPVLLVAYQSGPMPGVTGGFGEPTCQQCHGGSPVNDPAGSIQLDLPDGYRPGSQYRITVRLTRPKVTVGGFELSARFAEGTRRGEQAGRLRAVDGRTQVVTGPDKRLAYAQHTAEGSEAPKPGALTWTVEWTAPVQAAGPVVFDVAANASNGDASALGDHVYQVSAKVPRSNVPGSIPRSKGSVQRSTGSVPGPQIRCQGSMAGTLSP